MDEKLDDVPLLQSESRLSILPSLSSSSPLVQQASRPLLLQILLLHVGPVQTWLENESELTDVLTLLLERLELLIDELIFGTAGVAGVPVPGFG